MAQCSEGNETCSETPRAPLDFPLSRSVWIDSSLTLDNEVPSVKSGVINGEGDGTVALISLGAMCVNGWKQKRYNPAGIKVVTHEMLHQPLPRDLRGGPATAVRMTSSGWPLLILAAGSRRYPRQPRAERSHPQGGCRPGRPHLEPDPDQNRRHCRENQVGRVAGLSHQRTSGPYSIARLVLRQPIGAPFRDERVVDASKAL
jgi:hypothetical protein